MKKLTSNNADDFEVKTCFIESFEEIGWNDPFPEMLTALTSN